jgi:RimJ/RimL family protein N-acetyltransferase
MENAEILTGKFIRLEPLEESHAEGLANAAAADSSLYAWSPVPQGIQAAKQYIQTALELQAAGSALAFATIRMADDVVIGSTRFFNIEYWTWAESNARFNRGVPDACEIGYTWLTKTAIRTAANTEAKLLMLQMAFEKWQVFRVCLHTDARNAKSRAAIERIGGKMEGILRAHRLAVDQIPRDSARFSILLSEWPEVKQRLQKLLER